MPIAVTFYDVVLWVHISAVVVGFGATFGYGIFLAVAAKEAPRSIPGILAGMITTDRTLVTIGGTVVLLSGLYLTADRWDFGEFFVAWGVIAVFALLGLTGGFFTPNERRAKAAAERDVERADQAGRPVEFGAEFNEASGKLSRMGPIAGLLIILTIYVMTAKPFL